uniref:Uncharacterized protein n=1 Tax=Panagrolaimus sp. ES5 TaxID=591445 RepID=A0AC34GY62_9BILA
MRPEFLWFDGKLLGKRAAKSVVDATATVAEGIAEASAGAEIGGVIGEPVGASGGILSESFVHLVVENLTQKFFDLPVTVAVEKAYDYFG